jgi:hypothetical protein
MRGGWPALARNWSRNDGAGSGNHQLAAEGLSGRCAANPSPIEAISGWRARKPSRPRPRQKKFRRLATVDWAGLLQAFNPGETSGRQLRQNMTGLDAPAAQCLCGNSPRDEPACLRGTRCLGWRHGGHYWPIGRRQRGRDDREHSGRVAASVQVRLHSSDQHRDQHCRALLSAGRGPERHLAFFSSGALSLVRIRRR